MRSFKLFGGGCVAALKRIKEGGGYCIFKKDKKRMGTYMEGVRERVGQGVEGTTGDG